MDLFIYVVFSVLYIMIMHFAVAMKNEFNLWLMAGIFVLGGVVGGSMGNYETGFVLAAVLSLVFW